MNKIGRYFLNVALGVDQLGNTLWGGSPDETISSRLGRLKMANGGTIPMTRPWARALSWCLDKIDKDHCRRSIEADEITQITTESVIDGDVYTKTTYLKPEEKKCP